MTLLATTDVRVASGTSSTPDPPPMTGPDEAGFSHYRDPPTPVGTPSIAADAPDLELEVETGGVTFSGGSTEDVRADDVVQTAS